MSSEYVPTDQELQHMGNLVDDSIKETFAHLSAGRCLYCDCGSFDNSMGLNSGMDCNCGHPFDCHIA